jgi:iron(III) transport system permease protein
MTVPSPLRIAAVCAALVALAPLAAVAVTATGPGADSLTWATFARYAWTSAALAVMVGIGAGVLGALAAWLVALNDFPGRRIFAWALVLPLAAPAFVLAYGYADLFDVAGPVRTAWRGAFGWDPPFDMRSIWGAAIVLSLAFYPYVYLTLRAALLNQASSQMEAARSLGLSRWQAFRKVALPLARPALAAGMALAIMETLADYGATSYLAVQTLTTGVVRAWSVFASVAEAARLALPLLGAAAILLIVERAQRRAMREAGSARWRPLQPEPLSGGKAALAVLFCTALIALGLLLPLGWLIAKGWNAPHETARIIASARNALVLAGIAAGVTTLLALAIALGARRGRILNRVVSLGYATPGAVMAIGLMGPAALIWRAWPSMVTSLAMAMTLLILAYASRLMAAALEPIEGGLSRISPSMQGAARSLGETEASAARRVDLPIASGAVFTAALLVFIDVLKELPATVILRPFGFDTLAVMADYYAKDERLGEAAWPGVIIVLIGIPAVIWLTRKVTASRPGAVA